MLMLFCTVPKQSGPLSVIVLPAVARHQYTGLSIGSYHVYTAWKTSSLTSCTTPLSQQTKTTKCLDYDVQLTNIITYRHLRIYGSRQKRICNVPHLPLLLHASLPPKTRCMCEVCLLEYQFRLIKLSTRFGEHAYVRQRRT